MVEPCAILLIDGAGRIDDTTRQALSGLGQLIMCRTADEAEQEIRFNSDIIRLVITVEGLEDRLIDFRKIKEEGPKYLLGLLVQEKLPPKVNQRREARWFAYHERALPQEVVTKTRSLIRSQDSALSKVTDQNWYCLHKILEGCEKLYRGDRIQKNLGPGRVGILNQIAGFGPLSREAQGWLESENRKKYQQRTVSSKGCTLGPEQMERFFPNLLGLNERVAIPLVDSLLKRLTFKMWTESSFFGITDIQRSGEGGDRKKFIAVVDGKLVEISFDLEDIYNDSDESWWLEKGLLVKCSNQRISEELMGMIHEFIRQQEVEGLIDEAAGKLRESKIHHLPDEIQVFYLMRE